MGTLLGFRARTAAAGGMLLSLMFFLTVSWSTTPYYYGADIVFFFAWTALILGGPGSFSVDAKLATRHAAERKARPSRASDTVNRRAAVRRMGITTALGTFVVIFGGLVAAIGRMVSSAGSGGTSGAPPLSGATSSTKPSSGSGTTPTTATKGSGGAPKGKRIGPASGVPVGGAASFTEQGLPAYVVQPKAAEYLGFSAICTHEGCTVGYVQSVQQFQCPCHGSIYSALTGDVISGPAPRPLPKIAVSEADGQLYAS